MPIVHDFPDTSSRAETAPDIPDNHDDHGELLRQAVDGLRSAELAEFSANQNSKCGVRAATLRLELERALAGRSMRISSLLRAVGMEAK